MSTSFQTLRRLIADEVEPESWALGTTTAAGSTLSATASAFAMSGGDANALDGGSLYFCDGTLAGSERAIAAVGLTTSGGDIALGNAFSAVTPNAATFEVHLRYPVTRAGGMPWRAGYREMINDAARRLWFVDFLSVTAVTGQVRYLLDITTYPWLADRPVARVLDVIGPADTVTGVRPERSRTSWYIEDDAETPALVFRTGGYSTGDTFFLKVARPCHTRVKVGGTVWTDVSEASKNNGYVGVYLDTDEIHAIESHVVAMAITTSMNHLGMRQPAIDKEYWETRRRYWASVAAGIKFRRLPRKNDGRVRLEVSALGGGIMNRGSRRSGTWSGY